MFDTPESDSEQESTGLDHLSADDSLECLSEPASDSELCIVGIGASAGGLVALERLFDRMPVNSGIAFVVIQHLSPDYKSLMDELLGRRTRIPVCLAENGTKVEADHVYLMPAGTEMIISQQCLLLTDKDRGSELSLPIDRFFRSLAQDAGSRAVAVILSGTGSDGSRGIVDIHRAGGMVIVQQPNTAQFDGMPTRANETGIVDLVASPEDIPAALQRRANSLLQKEDPSVIEPQTGRTAIETIVRLLKASYGIDFSDYKPQTVLRRIERRQQLCRLSSLDRYVERISENPEELDSIYKDLLIGVTQFFRDQEVFARLENDILPKILERLSPNDECRLWVAGCATGEEPYSLAMLLSEQIERLGRPQPVKIFASDVHRASLDIASAGIYDESRLVNVSPERIRRYFTRRRDGYRISQDLRQMIIFAHHNVIRDAPFTRLDLVSCRNVLIYLRPSAQQKALSLFNFGLKTDGYLLLGNSESSGDEFSIVDERHRIFRKSRTARPNGLPTSFLVDPESKSGRRRNLALPSGVSFDRRLLASYDWLLDNYMPPALLVDNRLCLVHCFGNAGEFLVTRNGRVSNDIVHQMPDELRSIVSNAFSRLSEDPTPVVYNPTEVTTAHGKKTIRVTVRPVIHPGLETPHSLIVFEPVEVRGEVVSPVRLFDSQEVSRDRLLALESELNYAKEALQATIEELESGNEEQQATNEELVASNEELQSTNEELHSVNEELFTVNAEHQRKIAELTELTDDLDNLIRSTEIGTIFLDLGLRIRKFTPAIAEMFSLLPQDLGRRIDNFTNTIDHPSLLDDIERVVETGSIHEADVRDRLGNWFLLRILPYRHETHVDGVVLTLVDISSLKRVEEELRRKELEAREAVIHRDRFLTMLSHELRNPLAGIRNAAFLMQRQPLNKTAENALKVVHRQSSHMARLLDDLLDVSRVTQRKILMQEEIVDVVEATQEAISAVSHLFEAKGTTLHIDMSPVPLKITGDAARIQQIQVNLLSNAAKYTPDGGEVWLSVHQVDDEIAIKVRDNGVGLPPCMLESVFDLFVQSDHSLDRSEGGLGVGLTLVKAIVELHGGRISAHSDGPGCGCEFDVMLPMAPAIIVEELEPQEEPEHAPAASAGVSSRKRIVLVEDNFDNREMLRELLGIDGHEVLVAKDGMEGLQLIQESLPDVAVIDIGLPKLNGYELAKRLRSEPACSGVRLIALTGYGRDVDRFKAEEAGFNTHLVKPVDSEILMAALDVSLSPA